MGNKWVLGLILVVGGVGLCSATVVDLGKMNVYMDKITLSGFSAGSSMAIQTHMAHSSVFKGLAIFSQTFYHCGHRGLVEFGLRCGTYGLGLFPYRVSTSVHDAKEYEQAGLIDSLDNFKKQRIFIWTGQLDIYIPADMAAKNVDFYTQIGVDPNNIMFTLFKNASHLLPTTNFGPPCSDDAEKSFYLGNCNYAGAYHALAYLLEDPNLKESTPNTDQLKQFNQSAFYPGNIADVAMGTRGFIYIPKRCESGETQCLLHINFHGCNEWPPNIAEQYILNSGFLPVAEGSGIIMIFPLTTEVPQNMGGCWDFYSYTGNYFATKKGAQIRVIENLLNAVLNGK